MAALPPFFCARRSRALKAAPPAAARLHFPPMAENAN